MSRRRRNQGLIEDLLEMFAGLPFWVSIVGAGFAYLAFDYLLPRYASGSTLLAPAIASTERLFAPWVAFIVLAAGLVGVVQRFSRRHLFSKATRIELIRKMTWPDLELLVGEAYRRQRYTVTERGGSQPDEGIDIELDRNGERVLVQCKQWNRPVPVERVRELLGVVTAKGATRGVLVAPGGFTRDALEFAQGKPLELIDAKRLLRLTAGSVVPSEPASLVSNVSGSVSPPACPTCAKPMVKRTSQRGARAGSEFWGCSTFAQTGCRGTRAA